MAHHLYQTDGYILGSRPRGESNKLFQIFTRDLGLVSASAQSVRELKSKLRYSLQDYRPVKLSVVRGREMWRITGAEPGGDMPCLERDLPRARLMRIFALLRRMVRGEEADPALFGVIERAVAYMNLRSTEASESFWLSVECIAVLQVLRRLGHLKPVAELETYAEADGWTDSLVESLEPVRPVALRTINQSLAESSL